MFHVQYSPVAQEVWSIRGKERIKKDFKTYSMNFSCSVICSIKYPNQNRIEIGSNIIIQYHVSTETREKIEKVKRYTLTIGTFAF